MYRRCVPARVTAKHTDPRLTQHANLTMFIAQSVWQSYWTAGCHDILGKIRAKKAEVGYLWW
jgi:hypothetical protein